MPRSLLLVAGVVLAAGVPFLDQPFHMDDAIYLRIARHSFASVAYPQDFPILFEGVHAPDLASMEHPPLVPYVLAAAARLAGGFREEPLHAVCLVFPLLAVFSALSLARRFSGAPVAATLLLATMPVFWVLSHCLMSDMALLAFWTAAAALFVSGVDRARPLRIFAAAAFVLLALLVSYAAAMLVPLLVFYAVLKRSRTGAWLVAVVPLVGFAAWLALQSVHYGRFTPAAMIDYYFRTARVLSPPLVARKTVYSVAALGAVTVCPLVAFLVLRRRQRLWPALGGVLASAVLIETTEAAGYSRLERCLFGVCVTAGFVLLWSIVHALRVSKARDDALFLGAWFFGVLVFSVLFYMTGSARYLLPSTPPMALLLAAHAPTAGSPRRSALLWGVPLAAAALWAALVSAADYEFASIYRRFAADLRPALETFRGKLWFTGEWGFRSYLEALGAEELGRRDARPRPGDWIMVPRLASPYATLLSPELSLRAIVLLAPSELAFPIDDLPAGSTLVLALGMPFWRQSDGVDLDIRFAAGGRSRTLYATHVDPEAGRRWRELEIPLVSIAGERGELVFGLAPGPAGRADADWLALGRARIRRRSERGESVVLDLRAGLAAAEVRTQAGASYHTPSNRPVFVQEVWLEQEPAAALEALHVYRTHIPLRVLDDRVRAGFWSAGWGLLPFSIARPGEILEEIRVFRVLRSVDGYGEEAPAWYSEATGRPRSRTVGARNDRALHGRVVARSTVNRAAMAARSRR